MISKETFAAVQSLYDNVEDGYNQRIRKHIQKQMMTANCQAKCNTFEK